MSSYKLTYFNMRGRGEICRMLFALKGVKYEDERLTQEQWKERKASTVFGQLPELTVDGDVISQTKAIGRYLARKFNLVGSTAIEEAQTDAIVDFLEDMITPIILIYKSPEDQKEELKKKYELEQLPDFLLKLEKVLKTNKGGDGYFIGDTLTLADVAFFDRSTWPAHVNIEVNWDPVPKLKGLRDRVATEPNIAEWVKNRPVTEH